jgi:hypothetical protein
MSRVVIVISACNTLPVELHRLGYCDMLKHNGLSVGLLDVAWFAK